MDVETLEVLTGELSGTDSDGRTESRVINWTRLVGSRLFIVQSTAPPLNHLPTDRRSVLPLEPSSCPRPLSG